MDLYSQKGKSTSQKILIILLEVSIIAFSYWILFSGGYHTIFSSSGKKGNENRHLILFFFNCIVFLRICITMFVFIKRKIPWAEAFNIPIAFAMYYIGFAMLGYSNLNDIGSIDIAGIILFIAGSCTNTLAELLRYNWKKNPTNNGRLYTKGLFRYSMHINYFGDLLWVSGYALVTGNLYSILIVIFLFCFFAFYNIPMLDKHLSVKYGDEFNDYKKRTKKLIPFLF
jgi:protein-S-isoprenylcysteine O-methyltransferase Ste14